MEPDDVLTVVKERATKLAEYRCLETVDTLPSLIVVLKELEADNKVFITTDGKIMIVD